MRYSGDAFHDWRRSGRQSVQSNTDPSLNAPTGLKPHGGVIPKNPRNFHRIVTPSKQSGSMNIIWVPKQNCCSLFWRLSVDGVSTAHVPRLRELLRAAYPASHIAVFHDWDGFADLLEKHAPDVAARGRRGQHHGSGHRVLGGKPPGAHVPASG
jgi:hypothetical protein